MITRYKNTVEAGDIVLNEIGSKMAPDGDPLDLDFVELYNNTESKSHKIILSK